MSAPSVVWVGVDPGSRSTGITARNGHDVVAWDVVERSADETEVGPGVDYIRAVLAGINSMHTTVLDTVPALRMVRFAVEGVRRPNPHVNRRNGKATTDPTGVIGAAMVLGAVLADLAAIVVPPGGNGSGLLASYPHALVTDAERRKGVNRPAGQSAAIRHARSAWDVSVKAEQMLRLGGAA